MERSRLPARARIIKPLSVAAPLLAPAEGDVKAVVQKEFPRMREPTTLAVTRFARGMTQAELAARAGVTRNTVGRLEAGDLPTLKVAIKLAEALDEDLSRLFLPGREGERVGA